MTALATIAEQSPAEILARMTWLDDAETRRLLASMRADPPKSIEAHQTFAMTRDEWVVYTGHRVDRLRAIYERYAQSALDQSNAGDRRAWERHRATDPLLRDDGHASVPKDLWPSPVVDRVIYLAIEGEVFGLSGELDRAESRASGRMEYPAVKRRVAAARAALAEAAGL